MTYRQFRTVDPKVNDIVCFFAQLLSGYERGGEILPVQNWESVILGLCALYWSNERRRTHFFHLWKV